jgi:transcriptional regulator with XRE-family HTH domain
MRLSVRQGKGVAGHPPRGSLGDLVLRARRDLRLTQPRLAALSGLSVRSIREFESGRVGSPRDETLHLLAESLRLDEDVLRRAAGADDSKTPADIPGPHNPLPVSGAIIGREHELEVLRTRLLDDGQRLVTISGVSGMGKSRLAAETAREVTSLIGVDAHWLGAWQLGRPDGGAEVMDRIGDEPTLLVLDSSGERIEVDWVAEALRAFPRLIVLNSAPGPLELPGEWVLPLGPLELPTPAAGLDLAELGQLSSVRLLLSHILQVWPSFRLDDGNALVLAELCRLLDGLPYALASAASACLLESPEDLLGQVSRDPFAAPAQPPAEGLGLRERLSENVRAVEPMTGGLLPRLAELEDDWTVREAADRIGAGLPDLVRAVRLLVRHGILRTTARHGAARFQMLNLIRSLIV